MKNSKRDKKIAIITCTYPPYKGGIGNVAFEQVERLSALGYKSTVFTLSDSESSDNPIVTPLKCWFRLGNAGFCPSLIWRLRDFDIVLLHYPFYGSAGFVWLSKLLGFLQGRLFLFFHMDASFSNLFFRFLSLPSFVIRGSLFRMADRVFCASLDYVKHSSISGIYRELRDRFVEAPFGSKLSPKKSDQNNLTKIHDQYNLRTEDKTILFVGGLDRAHYFKGVSVLLESFALIFDQVPEAKLIIIGDGDLRSYYEKESRKIGIKDRVIFTGSVSDEDLSTFYSLASLFILPSSTKAEAFGLVIADAKQFGLPVIASDLPGVRDVVGDGGLLVKSGDVEDLSTKIIKILTDPILSSNLSEKSLEESIKYNWSSHIERLEKEIIKN